MLFSYRLLLLAQTVQNFNLNSPPSCDCSGVDIVVVAAADAVVAAADAAAAAFFFF
jgi:hypothetical protein